MAELPEPIPTNDGAELERPLSDVLLAAVSRTLEATAGPAEETRQRAQGLLDEVARRGQEAGGELMRRLREFGFAPVEEVDELGQRLAALEKRIATLEAGATSQSQVEG